MDRTRFKVEISYKLKNGFWDTVNCICELEPDERTLEGCKTCVAKKLSVPALYVEERILDSGYIRDVEVTPLEDLYCQQIIEDGSICTNRDVLQTCNACGRPFCRNHLDESGVCGSKECQEKTSGQNTTKRKG
ncbi:MAG: hypothetical protein ACE5R6_04045 [Candidatus Heimdallarchaeota archaeon]